MKTRLLAFGSVAALAIFATFTLAEPQELADPAPRGPSIALSAGSLPDEVEDATLERLLNGNSHIIHADCTTRLAEYYFKSPDGFAGAIREKLAFDIYWHWQHEKDIDLAYLRSRSTYRAKHQAADALRVLGCKNEADFFHSVSEMKSFQGNEQRFPEFFDTNSEEHRSFRTFVAKSAALIPNVDR